MGIEGLENLKDEEPQPLCDGKGTIDRGPQGTYSFPGERWLKCPGCIACNPHIRKS